MKTAIVIPVHNESATLAEVIRRIDCPGDWEAIVVDDGSIDGSGALARQLDRVTVLTHAKPRGYGAALLTGFDHALINGFDFIVTLDADLQHLPEMVGEIISRLQDADIVTGTRWHEESEVRVVAPPARREMNRRVLKLVRDHTGFDLTDAMCGFRAYAAETVRRLALSEPGYGINFQIWARASRLGLKVAEVPVPVIYPEVARPIGGGLDDPEVRFTYYERVVLRELGG
jgi:glycosyltransferase involved in cell wall biosynthesis